MKRILEGPSRRAGTIFQEIDTNFIEVCNAIFRLVYPNHTIRGYAEDEPNSPAPEDCYLVKETGTIWGLAVEKDDIVCRDDSSWVVGEFKITEINQALQANFFSADFIVLAPITGITGNNVQEALNEICAALVAEGIL